MVILLNLKTPWKIALLLLFIFELQAQDKKENSDKIEYETENDDPGDPWETPLQELKRVANKCNIKVTGYYEIATNAHITWQNCIDKISPKFPLLESRKFKSGDAKINDSVIQEIDKRLHMAICRNTTAYKGCWSSIFAALNLCEPGSGNVSETLYFALYDDICRDGGRITIENRRMASMEGRLCERDYATDECLKNKQFRNATNICTRFESNVACDLSSIDSKCTNSVDKRLHADIFTRVRASLKCSSPPQSSAINSCRNASIIQIIFIFFTVYSWVKVEQD